MSTRPETPWHRAHTHLPKQHRFCFLLGHPAFPHLFFLQAAALAVPVRRGPSARKPRCPRPQHPTRPRTLALLTAFVQPSSCTQILALALGGCSAGRQSPCALSTASRTSNKPSMRPRLRSRRRLFSAGTVNSSTLAPGSEPCGVRRAAINTGSAIPSHREQRHRETPHWETPHRETPHQYLASSARDGSRRRPPAAAPP